MGWGLAFGNYDPSLATQSEYTLYVESALFYVLPIICFICALIAMYFTNIDKIYPTIIKDLEERKRSAQTIKDK